MHLLATKPGGFVDDAAGIARIEQNPADIVILSAANTCGSRKLVTFEIPHIFSTTYDHLLSLAILPAIEQKPMQPVGGEFQFHIKIRALGGI